MEYLEFELPIKELQEQYDKACKIGEESNVDVSNTCKQIEKNWSIPKRKFIKT